MENNESPDIVVVGHVAIDKNKFPKGMIESAIGGAPTYTGLALAALGVRVGLVAKVGVDFTDQFPPIYSRLGLDTEGLYVSGAYTTTFENTYDENGTRTQICKHVAPKIAPEDIPDPYLGAKGFYISPLANEVSPEVVARIKGNNLVMMDPQGIFRRIDTKGKVTRDSKVDLKPFLKHVDIVKIGRDEVGALGKDLKPFVKELCTMGPKIAILTQGKDPLLVFSDDLFHEIKPLKVQAKDTTGAGDVLGGVFLARYIETSDVIESVKFAAAAAGLKTRFKGPTGYPSRGEIIAATKKI